MPFNDEDSTVDSFTERAGLITRAERVLSKFCIERTRWAEVRSVPIVKKLNFAVVPNSPASYSASPASYSASTGVYTIDSINVYYLDMSSFTMRVGKCAPT